MKKIRLISALILFCMATAVQAKDFSIKGYSIKSISPQGLTSAGGTISFDIDNFGDNVNFSNISGSVYLMGQKLGDYTVEPFVIPERTRTEVPVSGSFMVSAEASILELMKLIPDISLNNLTVDVTLDFETGGRCVHFVKKGVPVAALINR